MKINYTEHFCLGVYVNWLHFWSFQCRFTQLLSRLGMNNRVCSILSRKFSLSRKLAGQTLCCIGSLVFIETAAIFKQKIFMKIYFTRLLLRWYERNSLSQSPKDVLWPSPPQKTDINNKFYDLISLSEPCTFFVIFPSSRAAENVFAKGVITKDVRRNRIYVRKKNQKKSLRSGTERNEARSEFCRSDNNEKDGYERYVRV